MHHAVPLCLALLVAALTLMLGSDAKNAKVCSVAQSKRVNAGWGGVGPAACLRMPHTCFKWSRPRCYFEANSRCAVFPKDRALCGYPGIPLGPCRSAGCCFTYASWPRCFFPAGTKCVVKNSQKQQVGYRGIPYNGCKAKGGCYSQGHWPRCYYATGRCDMADVFRKDCGHHGIQAHQCLAKGCCYGAPKKDKKKPWCYYSNPECTCDIKASNRSWKVLSFKFFMNEAKLAAQKPEVMKTKYMENGGKPTMEYTFEYEQTVSKEQSWTHETGVSITTGMSFKAGLPKIAETEISVEIGLHYTFGYGVTTSTSKTFKDSTKVYIPGGKTYKFEASAKKGKMVIPYEMVVVRRDDPYCKCTATGSWSGVDFHTSRVKVIDATPKSKRDVEKRDTNNDALDIVERNSDKCRETKNGWRCTNSDGIEYVEYDNFAFPASVVKTLKKVSSKTTSECNSVCSNDKNCAGFVRKRAAPLKKAADCWIVPPGVLKNKCVVKDNDEVFEVFKQAGRPNNCMAEQ